MSFAQEIMRSIEDALNNLRVPASSLVGQIAGALLPPPAADADVPYAATDHTHPLSDLEQSGATDGQVVTWDDGTSAWIPADATSASIPLTTRGDLLTRDASANVRLPIGAAATFLRSDGTDPSWQNISDTDLPIINLTSSPILAGTLPIANGGTGDTTAIGAFDSLSPLTTTGDLIYHNGTHNVRLGVGSASQVLTVVGGVPVWGPSVSTYTPTYTGVTTAGTTTYALQVGRYTQIGKWVFVSITVQWTNATGTGDAQVSLPIAAQSSAVNMVQTIAVRTVGVTFTGSGVQAVITAGAGSVIFRTPVTNAASPAISVETAGTIVLTGVYEVD